MGRGAKIKKYWPIILCLYLAVRGILLFIAPYNVDEMSHMHLSDLHTQGWRYIIDDGDIARTPLLRYFLAPLIGLFGTKSLLGYRIALSIISYAALLLFYKLIRRSSSASEAALATFCFAFSLPYFIAAQQIRYEPFQLLFFIGALHIAALSDYDNAKIPWKVVAGFLISLAVVLKILVAPYALAYLVVVFALPGPKGFFARIKRSAWPLLGMLLPSLLIFHFYHLLIKAILVSPDGLFDSLVSSVASFTGGIFNISTFRHLIGQPLFWSLGLMAAFLAVFSAKRVFRDQPYALVMLLGTALYFISAPLVKKQVYLQDLIFPALTFAVCIGYAMRRIRISKAAGTIVIIVLALEGLASSLYFTLAPLRELDLYRMKSNHIQEKVLSYHKPPRPGDVFLTLYKHTPPDPYNYVMTRAEQDCGIRYFNRVVGEDETAIAANSMNVFRKSPYAWSAGYIALADVGIDHLWRQNLNLPETFRQFYMCTNAIILGDPRMRDIEDNLIRELDFFKPRVVLLDRFMLDIWFEYPSYRKHYDANYEIRYNDESRLVFAHRRSGAWKYSELPKFEFWDCAYDFIDRKDSPLKAPPESVTD